MALLAQIAAYAGATAPWSRGLPTSMQRRLHSGLLLLLLLHARLARVDCANWLHVDGHCDISGGAHRTSKRHSCRAGETVGLESG
jgi:hypothetical protein